MPPELHWKISVAVQYPEQCFPLGMRNLCSNDGCSFPRVSAIDKGMNGNIASSEHGAHDG